MIDRHAARILAMQSLCLFESLQGDFIEQLEDFLSDEGPPDDVRAYARRIVLTVKDRLDELDADLQAVSPNWQLARMAMVDRNILRVAICELSAEFDVPPKVVVDEAIEIAKAFGTIESPAFINGVLDAVIHRKPMGEDGAAGPADVTPDNSPPGSEVGKPIA